MIWYFSKLSERKDFLGAEYVDLKGSLQLLTSSHLLEKDKMLLRATLCGEGRRRGLERIPTWQGKKEDVPCRFCGKRDGDGHLFRECTFPSLLHVRELPEFASLMSLDSCR